MGAGLDLAGIENENDLQLVPVSCITRETVTERGRLRLEKLISYSGIRRIRW